MNLVAGLGNPGLEYAATRHNIGFMAVDAWHRHWNFGAWQKKFHGLVADGVVDGTKILLLKPMTFMNRSGLAVGEAAAFYKIVPNDIVVFHDEIELLPGKVRVKTGGGHAGHNGLKSVDAAVGSEYRRVRLGVGRPPEGREAVHDYVLHAFAKADQVWLDPLLRTLAQEAALLLAGNDGEYMNRMVRGLSSPEKVKKEKA